MQLSDAKIGKLNQGVIFTCGRAERYRDVPVFGLVITARCDIDQEKYPVLNYLPVVGLDEWLRFDGFDLLQAQVRKDCAAKLKELITGHGIAESVLTAHTPRELLQDFCSGVNKKQKEISRFEACVERHEMAFSELDVFDHKKYSEFFEKFAPFKSALVSDLIKQKISGYYFIPDVYQDGDFKGYVALLREVTFIPRKIAIQIARGVEKNGLQADDAANVEAFLSFDKDDFAMPISQIPSPHIEHILQSFSFMFGRIGLPDADPELISRMARLLPTERPVVA